MEWIQNNHYLFSLVVGLVIGVIYNVTLGKKIRARNFEKQINNKSSFCAKCNKHYDDDNNYFTVRRLNYCSSCFERMFYDIKLGGGFVGVLTISAIAIMISFFASKLVNGSATSDDYWKLVGQLVMFGLLLVWLTRSYRELKKAKKDHQRRTATSPNTLHR